MTAAANNVLFGWPIYSDPSSLYTPTFSGGSWSATLPLTNVATRYLSEVARSADALAASTKFDTDLKTARSVRCIAILLPNVTKSATPTVRFELSNASNFASDTYDTGNLQCWPTGYTAETADGLNVWYVAIIPIGTTASRYVRTSIVDTGNADGYVDVARLCVCDGWQPDTNVEVGAKLTWDTSTSNTESDGGAMIYNARRNRRKVEVTLPSESESEWMTYPWRMYYRLGKSGQFFLVWDPTDTTYKQDRSFLAVFEELSPTDFAYYNRVNTPLMMREEI